MSHPGAGEDFRSDRDLLAFLQSDPPLIDVRAPVEFARGSIPGATNLPLLNDDERAEVGTVYKRQGQDAAIALGHGFLSGRTREERVGAWVAFARAHPDAAIYCFRGGLRSNSVRAAVAEAGIRLPLIDGGYKRARALLLQSLEDSCQRLDFRVISGRTGCGKTELLLELGARLPACDLEGLAAHRGSAFGAFPGKPQPAQADFENRLALQLSRFPRGCGPVLIEDESRLIGRLLVPPVLFARMSASPVYLLECPRPERARRLCRSYLADGFAISDGEAPPEKLEALRATVNASLRGIANRLGGLETQTILGMVEDALAAHARTGRIASHHAWVERLLERYYDPLYDHHLAQLEGRIAASGDWPALMKALSGATGADAG